MVDIILNLINRSLRLFIKCNRKDVQLYVVHPMSCRRLLHNRPDIKNKTNLLFLVKDEYIKKEK